MRNWHWALAICALALSGGVAQAATSWQSVHLKDGITMEIPAAVGETYKPAPDSDPRELLFMGAEAGDSTLFCDMMEMPYSEDAPRADYVKGAASDAGEGFCAQDDPLISNYLLNDAHSVKVDGTKAMRCVAAYSDAGDKANPGKVVSFVILAGKKASYHLMCNVEQMNREGAIYAYVTDWKDVIDHMQQSIHLPAKEK